MFRPCIDIHDGQVKQIVGSTLLDTDQAAGPVTHFTSPRPGSWYARLYRQDNLQGGHVIMLGPGNESAALEALAAWPGGMQLGGGVNADNASRFLDGGASHVIVTSWVFREGRIDFDRLRRLVEAIGKERLVLDLSCRRRHDGYYVATDRWQKTTDTRIDAESLAVLSDHCDEFLVHAVDVEGKQSGVDLELVALLGRLSPVTATYAGGVRHLGDLEALRQAGEGRVAVTVGSALDIFGGPLAYRDVVAWHRQATAPEHP